MAKKKPKKPTGGRPPKSEAERLVVLPLRAHPAIVAALDRYRARRYRSRTDVIREALVEFLIRNGCPPDPAILADGDGTLTIDSTGLSEEEFRRKGREVADDFGITPAE